MKICISFVDVGQSLSPSDDKQWCYTSNYAGRRGLGEVGARIGMIGIWMSKLFGLASNLKIWQFLAKFESILVNYSVQSLIANNSLDMDLRQKLRLYPHTLLEPMDPMACRTHACQGYWFEIAQLEISVIKCDCCDRRHLVSSDPWLKSSRGNKSCRLP
jgi:hypothetical protein